MYIIVYKNGIRMRTTDEAMQKVIQAMHRAGIDIIELRYEENKKKEIKKITVFITKRNVLGDTNG